MRTRTLLTTPPGEQPTADSGIPRDREHYSRGFRVPAEPRVPGRYRTLAMSVLVLVVVAAAGYAAFTLLVRGQHQDPSLGGASEPAPTTTAGSLPGEGG